MRLGRYEIVRKIATGGMADVFLALQWGDGGFVREVVLKRLHPHHLGETALLEDFRNEADLLARLRYSGIPQVFEFRCSERDEWYMAMEHVRGPTLRELVDSAVGRRLPLPVALATGLGLARLLHQVHETVDSASGIELGVVHGDITPGNVIADVQGNVHLLDFGIAGSEVHRQKRREHGIRGTVGYFPPEAIGGDLPDRRADVFSLGAVLYEVLLGERPFSPDSVQYMNAIAEGPGDRDFGGLPAALKDLVLRCLHPDRNERPASAGDVAAALVQVAASTSTPVGPHVLGDHVDTYFPPQDEAPTRVGEPSRNFVVAIPEGETDALSAAERDELLADLDLFAPDAPIEDLFDEPIIDASEFETVEEAEPPPPPPRALRSEKRTPVAFPTPDDLASTLPEELDEWAEEPAKSDRKTGPRPRSRTTVDDARLSPRASASSDSPDSGGFYIYVADDE